MTLKGMVDTKQTSYAVIRVDENRIQITGYGREEDRIMLIRNQANKPVQTTANAASDL